MARRYRRDNLGRFAGSYGGSSTSSGGRPGGGTRLAGKPPARSGPPPKKPSRKKGLSPQMKQRLVVAGVTAGTGVAAKVALSKALPTQRYATSKKSIQGEMREVTVGKGIRVTEVKGADATFTTRSVTSGRGLGRRTETTTFITKGGTKNKPNLVGIVHSERRAVGAASIKTSYLTQANRGKGLGGQAVVAHAAHAPRVSHRASITRSLQGQGFAKAMGGAGARSKKSKEKGAALTREMNAQWKYSKFDYGQVLKVSSDNVKKGTLSNAAALKTKRRIGR